MNQNIYLEAGFDDEEATVMALEADAAIAIAHYIRANFPNNQTAASKRLRIGQNEVSAILRGNVTRFSLPKLIRIARRAGLRLYFDMGDRAECAHATSLAPSVFRSSVLVGISDTSSLLIDKALELQAAMSQRAASSRVQRH